MECVDENHLSRCEYCANESRYLHERADEIGSWAVTARELLEMAIEENEDSGRRTSLLNACDGLLHLIADGVGTGAEAIRAETLSPQEEKPITVPSRPVGVPSGSA